jgi:hypothetical protein
LITDPLGDGFFMDVAACEAVTILMSAPLGRVADQQIKNAGFDKMNM